MEGRAVGEGGPGVQRRAGAVCAASGLVDAFTRQEVVPFWRWETGLGLVLVTCLYTPALETGCFFWWQKTA